MKAATAKDIQTNRGLWQDVAAQLRNRTMPPMESKLSEDDRLRISTWIDIRLRETACDVGTYAGASAVRRLNRREYRNTIRDILGVDFNVSEMFPNDGTGARRLRLCPAWIRTTHHYWLPYNGTRRAFSICCGSSRSLFVARVAPAIAFGWTSISNRFDPWKPGCKRRFVHKNAGSIKVSSLWNVPVRASRRRARNIFA